MSRLPRRSPKAFLEGAPPYILSVFDCPDCNADRYTVLFGWPISADTSPDPRVQWLGFNECPTNPGKGISQWGECYANGRSGLGNLIKWSELPEHLQQHVIWRANYQDKIQIVRLARVGTDETVWFKPVGHDRNGRPRNRTMVRRPPIWGFEPLEGVGYFGPTFSSKKEARAHAKAKGIIIVEGAK